MILHQRTTARRAGFTLIEILVVIAIITILMAFATAGTLKLMAEQQVKATEATLEKLGAQLSLHWRAALDTANNTDLDLAPSSITQMAGGDKRKARVLFNKFYMQREFPMRYSHVQGPAGGLLPKPSYTKYIQRAMGNGGHNESSVLLVMALREQRRGGGQAPESYLSSGELLDRFGDGVPEVVDAWGFSIELFLWPAYDTNLNPPGTFQTDPLDPEGQLNSMGSSFDLHPVQAGGSYLLQPVIASPGKNGLFGLSPDRFMGVLDPALAGDNVYSYKKR